MSLARAAALTADRLVPSITRALSDPTDLLHYWSLRAPARGSSLNAVTLYRVSDAAQADFSFDARGRLPLAAIQAWAGITTEPDGTVLGVNATWAQELNLQSSWSVGGTGAAPSAKVVTSTGPGGMLRLVSMSGKFYEVAVTGTIAEGSGPLTIGFTTGTTEPLQTDSVVYRRSTSGAFETSAILAGNAWLYIRFASAGTVTFDSLSVREVNPDLSSLVRVARVWDSSATQLGPELVTNGDFSDGTTGWTNYLPASLTVVDGRLRVVYTSSTGPLGTQAIATIAGRRYRAKAEISNATANQRGRIICHSVTTSGYFATGNEIPSGSLSLDFVAVGSTTYVSVQVLSGNSAGASADFDNVSVREVLTANAVQTTVASMPFFDLATGGILGTSGSSLVATLPAQATDAKIVLANQAGVAVTTATVNSGAYTVQSASQLRERVILKADTPDADVEKVKRALMRAWKLPEAA